MVVKATAVGSPNPIAEMIRDADEAMMLLITGAMWETLVRQGAAEGISPGQVLDKALRVYLEAHGAPDTVAYLHAIAGARR